MVQDAGFPSVDLPLRISLFLLSPHMLVGYALSCALCPCHADPQAEKMTMYDAIHKYTGVPEADVVYAVWRSLVFEPAHYVAIDRTARKIVVAVRQVISFFTYL